MKSPDLYPSRSGWLAMAAEALLDTVLPNMGLEVSAAISVCSVMPEDGMGCTREASHSFEVFVGATETYAVFAQLLHELVHIACNDLVWHSLQFRDIGARVGLVGSLQEPRLDPYSFAWLVANQFVWRHGHYNADVAFEARPPAWAMWQSLDDPNYVVYVPTKQVLRRGRPRDPRGVQMVPVDRGQLFKKGRQ